MTTQQQQDPQTEQPPPAEQPPPTEQPPTDQPPQDLALRVGKLEGLVHMLIEQQRALAERIDRLTLAVLGGALLIAGSIIGGLIAIIITVL